MILLDEKAIQEVTINVPNGDSFLECFQNCYKAVAHAQARAILKELQLINHISLGAFGVMIHLEKFVDQLESELSKEK